VSSSDHNPLYPRTLGPTVAKFRTLTRDGLRTLTWDDRQAYGAAVEKAILALQRSGARVGLNPLNPRCRCASGTWHSEGGDIHEAVRKTQHNALLACPGAIRRKRTPNEWATMYENAMDEKAAAIAARIPAGSGIAEAA